MLKNSHVTIPPETDIMEDIAGCYFNKAMVTQQPSKSFMASLYHRTLIPKV